MKKIIYRITSIAVLFMAIFIVGCEEQLTVFEGPYHVRFTGTSSSQKESSISETVIKIHYAGSQPAESIQVDFSFTGGTEGVDFTLIGGTSLTIPAGEWFTSFSVKPIDNQVADGDKVITFEITSVSGDISAGLGLVGKKFTYTITDDDCPFKVDYFIGTLVCQEPGYAGSPYDVGSTVDPGNPNAIIIDNFWDYGGEVKYIFDPATNKVDLPTQNVVMGGDTYVVSSNGQGTYEACSKKFIVPYKVSFAGDVYDENTHTFTKK